MHLDERSAAFFSLGMARRLNEPVAMVCSSGTAAANFLPAIVEARYSSVPLLVLTADRPSEMVGWGALQTIDQTRIYGSHAKWSVNMPLPEVTLNLMAYVRAMAGRALATAVETPAGPVHLNFPFREPLEPVTVAEDLPPEIADPSAQAYHGRSGKQPFLSRQPDRKAALNGEAQRLAAELASIEKGLIVCGPDSDMSPEDIITLACRLGYPILADCLSQVRCGPHDREMVIDCYDSFIENGEATGLPAPEVIIRFGALPVSKPLTAYLQRHPAARHILVDDGARWQDPFYLTGETWQTGRSGFCLELSASLKAKRPTGEWLLHWRALAETARAVISGELTILDEMFEGKVFSELSRLMPCDSLIFAGNSMPVRDMDTFFPSTERSFRFMANRGASGIDGLVSTALGAGAVSSGKTVLVLGDISFYHDMNGLLAAGAFNLDATIIVINNNGGGIFSFLPQAAYEDIFEPYFGTPHGLTFRSAAELYGLDYCLAGDWPTFIGAVKKSLAETGTMIIEVPGDRKLNLERHRQIREAVDAAIRRVRGDGDDAHGA